MKNTIVFFDDYMLWDYQGIRKRIFKAENMGIDILTDSPKEIGGRVMYDSDRKVYKFWKKVLDINSDSITKMKAYESQDLRNWTEVLDENISADDESRSMLLRGHVAMDRFEPDPAKKFKCTYIDRNPDHSGNGYIATSPDGISWEEGKENNFCNHISDSINNTFYNPVTKEYQTILRGGFIERRIFSKTSKDLKNWSGLRCLMSPTPEDEPCTEYYGMVVFPQEGYFLGYLWKYLPPKNDTAKTKMAGKADTHLVYSYDGNCWNEAYRTPLVDRPLPPAHGSAGIYLATMNDSTDGKSWILSGDIRRIDHACGFKPVYPDSEIPALAKKEGFAATGLYSIRKEGFVALESISNQSEITFKRILLNNDDLAFNISAPLGWAKFQISDNDGIIPGFSFDDCIPFMDDDQIRYRPQWKSNHLSELKGRSIIVQVRMYTALLFSMSGDFHIHNAYFPMESLGNPSGID